MLQNLDTIQQEIQTVIGRSFFQFDWIWNTFVKERRFNYNGVEKNKS